MYNSFNNFTTSIGVTFEQISVKPTTSEKKMVTPEKGSASAGRPARRSSATFGGRISWIKDRFSLRSLFSCETISYNKSSKPNGELAAVLTTYIRRQRCSYYNGSRTSAVTVVITTQLLTDFPVPSSSD